jgi:hypothetical protein
VSPPTTDSERLSPGRIDRALVVACSISCLAAVALAVVNDLPLAIAALALAIALGQAQLAVVSLRLVQITKRQRHRRVTAAARTPAASEGS